MSETTSPKRARPIRRTSGGDSPVVRALALLMEVARSRRGVLLKAFAEQRGYPLRNVYRARDVLKRAGAPLLVNPDHPGRWQLADGWLPASVVGPARTELLALFVARQFAPGLKGTAISRSLDSLWAKLVSPSAQQSLELEPRAPMLSVRGLATIDYGPHHGVVEQLSKAAENQHAVWIRYRTAGGTVSDRVIEPGFLHWDGALEALYVPSWCRLRVAVRVFAVHRILAVEAMPADASRSVPRRDLLEKAFRVWHRDHAEAVEIWFSDAIAGEIRERTWHASQRLVDDRSGGVRLHLELAAPEELERWLAGFGADARVLAPQRLAESIKALHLRAANDGQILGAIARPLRAATASPRKKRTQGQRE